MLFQTWALACDVTFGLTEDLVHKLQACITILDKPQFSQARGLLFKLKLDIAVG